MNASELAKAEHLKDFNIVKFCCDFEWDFKSSTGIVIGGKIIGINGYDLVEEMIEDSDVYYIDKIYENKNIWTLEGIRQLLEGGYEELPVLYDREDYLVSKQIQLKDVELNKPFRIINSNLGKRIVKDEIAVCVKPFDRKMIVYRDSNIAIPLRDHNEDLLVEYI